MLVLVVFPVSAVCAALAGCTPEADEFDAPNVGPTVIIPPPKPQPEKLAAAQGKPAYITIDEQSVYWTNSGTGQVMKVPLGGGSPTTLATGQFEPRGIAVSEGGVFWSNFKGSTVMRLPEGGTTPVIVAQGAFQPMSVVADSEAVYWSELAINGTIVRADLPNGAPTDIHPDQTSPQGLSACGDSLYWANGTGGQIQRGPRTGGFRGYVASGQSHPVATACDETHVYWVNQGGFGATDGAVARVTIQGGNPQLLAGGQNRPQGVAVDDHHVYWTTGDGKVLRVAKGGGAVETVAENQEEPQALALSATHVYWVNEGNGPTDGAVMRFAKP